MVNYLFFTHYRPFAATVFGTFFYTPDPENGVFNNMDQFTLTDSWLYNQRAHSGTDNSPLGEVCSLESTLGCDELGAPNMALDFLLGGF